MAKCPYCDFNSHVSNSIDADVWSDAYEAELKRVAADTPDVRLRSVYFGGGTPSLMPNHVVDRILQTVQASWPLNNDLEITLEANPTSVEAKRFAGYRDAGVNRISVGIQSFRDHDLKRLGRLHSVEEAKVALGVAQGLFDRVSFDLIYGRQEQSLDDWTVELTEALEMANGHLSLYQLTIEPGTAFASRFDKGLLRDLPDEDLAADLYEVTQDICGAAGLPAYEISNHAEPGQESRHNLVYWEGLEYLAVGPGAHGRLLVDGNWHGIESHRMPSNWLAAVKSGSGEIERTAISKVDRQIEVLMMGLRKRDGIELEKVNALQLGNTENLMSLGLIEVNEHKMWLTDLGRPLLNEILRQMLV